MQDDRGSNIVGHETDRKRLERNPPTGASAAGKDVDLRAKSMRKRESGATESDEREQQEEQISE